MASGGQGRVGGDSESTELVLSEAVVPWAAAWGTAAAYMLAQGYPLVMATKKAKRTKVCDTKMRAKRRRYPPVCPRGHIRTCHIALVLEKSK